MERNMSLERHALGEPDLLFVKILIVMEEDEWREM